MLDPKKTIEEVEDLDNTHEPDDAELMEIECEIEDGLYDPLDDLCEGDVAENLSWLR